MQKRKYYFLLIFIFNIFCLTVTSQHRVIDSLYTVLKKAEKDTSKINAMNSLAWELRNSNPDTSITLSKTALKMAEKLNYEKGMARAFHNWAFLEYQKGNLDASLAYLNKAISMWKKLLKQKAQPVYALQGLSYSMGNLGNIYKDKSDYAKALEIYVEAYKLAEQLSASPDKTVAKTGKIGQAGNLSNIGLIYFAQGTGMKDTAEKRILFEKSLINYQKALDVDKEIGNKRGMCIRYGNIANIYYSNAQYAKALEYNLLSLNLALELGNVQMEINAYGNSGNAIRMQGDSAGKKGNNEFRRQKHNLAIEYHVKAYQLANKIGNRAVVANNLGNIGILLTEDPTLSSPKGETKKGYQLAEKYLIRSLNIYDSIGSLEFIQHMETNLSLLYRKMNNYEKAFDHYKRYILIRDSVYGIENYEKSMRTSMNFEFEKKEALAQAEHEKKQALAAEESKRQKMIIYVVIGGLLLVLVFSVLLFNRFRLTQKQNKIIEEQKHVVEEKNKEITDSINYAKRIQEAIIPSEEQVKAYLPASFILYKPKDIVAGDFYWMHVVSDSHVLIAAADCTGHGVPGAMVSVVCCNALNRSVKEFGLIHPAEILDKTRELVLETFSLSVGEVKDGMDISLVSIFSTMNSEFSTVSWAGANNPLWYLSNGEFKEIKADKQPIGKTDNPKPFTDHTFELRKNDILYLFTDGYPDQFGGPKGKKFKYSQFQEVLTSNSGNDVQDQKNTLNTTIENWKGSLEQVDDILVIGIKI